MAERQIKKISIVIPVYNEEAYIEGFIKDLYSKTADLPEIKQTIFVNDGSTDSTFSILKRLKNSSTIIINLPKNHGKGMALSVGINKAKESLPDAIICMDGDQQHDPHYLKDFIASLRKYPAVFGYRLLGTDTPWFRRFGNIIARFVIRTVFGIRRRDLLCGYMAFRSDIFDLLKWKSKDYGVEAEISVIIGREKLPIKEIFIKTIYLDVKKGVTILNAMGILFKIPFWYLKYKWKKSLFWLVLIMVGVVFGLLAFKNPFSVRSLVPNLEPFPDALFYSYPAWNFVHHGIFNMGIQGIGVVKSATPPLYSLFLIPFMWPIGDVRMFYFANFVLALASIAFFCLILRYFVNRNSGTLGILSIGICGLVLVSNFYVYTMPSLAMAENLTFFLVLISFYCVIVTPTIVRAALAGVLGIALLFIKFSNFPIAFIFYALYIYSLFKTNTNKKIMQTFLISLFFSVLIFTLYILSSRILVGHKNLSGSTSFSLKFFIPNFRFYLGTLVGGNTQYIWYHQMLINPIIAGLSTIGLVIGISKGKFRSAWVSIIFYVLATVFFMATFYVQDARYILHLLPLELVGLFLFFEFMRSHSNRIIFLIICAVFVISYLTMPKLNQKNESLFVTVKRQLGINFRHAETPWNYLAIQEFNSFFDAPKHRGAYLGTVLPPYLVEMYTNGAYHYLPITKGQDFFPGKDGLLEQMNISNISAYYMKLLKEKKEVYVSNYFLNNLAFWQADYNILLANFKQKLVHIGCLGSCNIYKLSLE